MPIARPPEHRWRLPPRRPGYLRWVGRVGVRDAPDQTGQLGQRLWFAQVGHDDGHQRVGQEGGDSPVEVLHLGVDGERAPRRCGRRDRSTAG